MTDEERIRQMLNAAGRLAHTFAERAVDVSTEIGELGKFERGFAAGDGTMELRLTLIKKSEG